MSLTLFACSGPGAGEAIQLNIETSQLHWLIFAGTTLLAFVVWAIRHDPWTILLPLFMSLLTLTHPYFSISATRGDCGMSKAENSEALTIFAICFISFQLILEVFLARRGLKIRGYSSPTKKAAGSMQGTSGR